VISQIGIEGFKTLEKVDVTLGDLNLFVGTNASGKSNFFDALRVLQGIGYGFRIDEIFDGKPKTENRDVWEGIRGGSAQAHFVDRRSARRADGSSVVRFALTLTPTPRIQGKSIRYSIGVSCPMGCVREEKLSVQRTASSSRYDDIFDSGPIENTPDSPVLGVRYYRGTAGHPPRLKFEKARPVLHQLGQHGHCRREHREVVESCIQTLSNLQRLDPTPNVLRDYSQAQAVKRMGNRGENFAAVVRAILADEGARSAYVSWLSQLTPTQPEDVEVLHGALGEALFAVKERGVVYPAPILSDGTLRFAAIAAAFLQPDMPDVLTIEEIENSIHPSRVRLLVELLRSQAKRGHQIMATTHSPIVLAWLREEEYSTTFFCKRDEETGASVIAPLTKVPRFMEIVRKQPIGDLFAEAWLEGAL